MDKCNVVRIHLKPGGEEGVVDRNKLIDFCLYNRGFQCVIIGWSCAYEDVAFPIETFDDYYKAVQEWNKKEQLKNGGTYRMNAAINRFSETKENDLFWTRDLDGNYWICRAKGKAEPFYNAELDIGAIVPVEAYMYGLEVPGQISSSFSRPRGGISESLKDGLVIAFSKKVFNDLSGKNVYSIREMQEEDIFDNLPPFDLEELVISYIQVMEGYYVLSNSIANKSTTIKIECEFRSRDIASPKRAVVQVKGGKDIEINAEEYKGYDDNGYVIYFYAPHIINLDKLKNGIRITKEELKTFYNEYKEILPDSITKWESIL